MTDDQRAKASEAARNVRVERYAAWLADDVDGLIHNVRPVAGVPCPYATAILAEARAAVALALSKLDQAVEADRKAHQQEIA